MKILIVDNEPAVRKVLIRLLESGTESHIIEEAGGVIDGLATIKAFAPDIVLLDIEMDDGTGFDLLKNIPEPDFQIIFTTAFNQYAIQAFKCSAIDYLLKPIDPVELFNALKKAQSVVNFRSLQQQLHILQQQVQDKTESIRQIVIKDIDKTYFLKTDDILYCEAEGSYTKFYLSNSEPVFVSRNLKYYEDLLSPTGFFRTHHSCLVNPSKIKIYDRKTDSGTLILEGGHNIPVSQRKKEMVLQLLENKGA